MKNDALTGQAQHLPCEVVETYSRPLVREVVEVYTRPLPARLAPPAPQQEATAKRPRKKRKGLWIFLGCLLLVVVLSAAAWFWN